LLPSSPPHQTGGAAQLASHSEAVADGTFSHQKQPQPAEHNHGSFSHVSVVPLHIMGTTTPSIVALSNTHQMVALKLTNTIYFYWRMQMKSYLLGQGVFHFVDGSVPYPPFYVSNSSDGSSSTINPSFLHWKQQDQLILSTLLLSSLFMDVLHLVVDCQTSSCVWRTLEKTLASPSNSRIMQLHRSFQDLRQGNVLVVTYMQHIKSLFDELVAVGQPLSLEDFNLYIFRGLRGEFKDLVTSFMTKAKPLLYIDLHNHILTHKLLHKTSFQSLAANSPMLPTPSLLPFTHLAQQQHNPNCSRNRGRSRGNWRSNNNRCSSQHRSNFHSSHSSAPIDWKQGHWQQPKRPAACVGSSILTGPLSKMSSVSYASSPSAIALYCAQLRSSDHQPSTHLVVGTVSAPTWFLNTGANQHVTLDLATLTDRV
jgi:hypothetical protein